MQAQKGPKGGETIPRGERWGGSGPVDARRTSIVGGWCGRVQMGGSPPGLPFYPGEPSDEPEEDERPERQGESDVIAEVAPHLIRPPDGSGDFLPL